MKTKQTTDRHTPGEWREFRDADSHDIIAPDGRHIARMEPHTNQDADAKLITAAPKLFKELEQCSNALYWIAQEAEQRAGVPRAIISGVRHHADKARAVLAALSPLTHSDKLKAVQPAERLSP